HLRCLFPQNQSVHASPAESVGSRKPPRRLSRFAVLRAELREHVCDRVRTRRGLVTTTSPSHRRVLSRWRGLEPIERTSPTFSGMSGGSAVESRAATGRLTWDRRCSSAAEQGSHKPRVGGSIPPTATITSRGGAHG